MSFASNLHLALAAPLGEISARHNFPPPTQPTSAIQNESVGAFSGPAGNAEGGSVHEGTAQNDGTLLGELQDLELVEAFSNNAGNGGHADSVTEASPLEKHFKLKGTSKSGRKEGKTKSSSSSSGKHLNYASQNQVENVYSGTGGNSKGGDVEGHKGIIKAFSGNAGDGGSSSSGSGLLV
ncbi:hypothetical protein V5O48_002222 [Marasmius crinis-equi]|uniref:Uncharacterized protein n=1 Tax=Marasmius crinis-equi TaxID=585013 RepID=A0ABR3FW91_9AGAR